MDLAWLQPDSAAYTDDSDHHQMRASLPFARAPPPQAVLETAPCDYFTHMASVFISCFHI